MNQLPDSETGVHMMITGMDQKLRPVSREQFAELTNGMNFEDISGKPLTVADFFVADEVEDIHDIEFKLPTGFIVFLREGIITKVISPYKLGAKENKIKQVLADARRLYDAEGVDEQTIEILPYVTGDYVSFDIPSLDSKSPYGDSVKGIVISINGMYIKLIDEKRNIKTVDASNAKLLRQESAKDRLKKLGITLGQKFPIPHKPSPYSEAMPLSFEVVGSFDKNVLLQYSPEDFHITAHIDYLQSLLD